MWLTKNLAPRAPAVLRGLFAAALALWVAVVLLHALFPGGFTGSTFATLGAYWAVAAFAAASVSHAALAAEGESRVFWALVAVGLLFRFAGSAGRAGFHLFDPARSVLVPGDVAYGVSYLLLFCALVWLVAKTTRRIALLSALDSASVMLSVSMLVWYFVLDPASAETGLDGPREVLVALSGPACDVGLLCLALVAVFAGRGRDRPHYAPFLVGAFCAFLVADGFYLRTRSLGPFEVGSWAELAWAAGVGVIGLAALTAEPNASFVRRVGVSPKAMFAFWFSPLSPAVHLAFLLLACGHARLPLPAYAVWGGAALVLHFAFRISMASYVGRKLREEAEALAKRAEQGRLSEELHDTLKQSVYSTALLLGSYKKAREKRGEAAAEEVLERAIGASREANHNVSRPIEELRVRSGASEPCLTELLRDALEDLRRHFRVKTHADLRADLGDLGADRAGAIYRIVSEALWNAAKHSGAENVWLESSEAGSAVLVCVRDDGRGMPAEGSRTGVGLPLMRARAEEAGGVLDVVSYPNGGTTVRASFGKR